MQVMPIKILKTENLRRQPVIETELIDQPKEVDFLAQEQYKLYFMCKQET